jgi:hypothetical protein
MTRGIEYHAYCVSRWRRKFILAEELGDEELMDCAMQCYQIHLVSVAYLVNPELFPEIKALK